MTMRTKGMGTTVGAALLALAVAACGGGDVPAENDAAMEGAGSMEHAEMDHGGMDHGGHDHMEPGAMRRHAEELDEATASLRAHLEEMRGSPDVWEARMGDHVREVGSFLSLMRSQMREMDMGPDAGHDAMGEMMGMSGEGHHRMMDDMDSLRAELEELQVASGAEVRDRMPAHLDRLERVVAMAEQSAEHMRAL